MRTVTVNAMIIAFALSGCATIINGAHQEMDVSTNPEGATVEVDRRMVGTTPITIPLKRKDRHHVRILLDGYEPFEMELRREASGWVWGNLAFGGVVGLAVDALTGGLYKLDPDVDFASVENGPSVQVETDRVIYVTLDYAANSGRTRIGTMKRNRD